MDTERTQSRFEQDRKQHERSLQEIIIIVIIIIIIRGFFCFVF